MDNTHSFRMTVVSKTGINHAYENDTITKQICEEWDGFPETLTVTKKWKAVAHLGNVCYMPVGSEGRSLGTVTVEWR